MLLRPTHTGALLECQGCGLQFDEDDGLRAHMREAHGAAEESRPLRLP